MSTAPTWSTVDDETYDLLSVIAEPHPIVGAGAVEIFLGACRRDAMAHNGLVSVNRVRGLLADSDIPPRRYSALWAANTGRDKAMAKAKDEHGADLWEFCEGSASGNDGRPYPLRRWIGAGDRDAMRARIHETDTGYLS